jgi:hypothetical protein
MVLLQVFQKGGRMPRMIIHSKFDFDVYCIERLVRLLTTHWSKIGLRGLEGQPPLGEHRTLVRELLDLLFSSQPRKRDGSAPQDRYEILHYVGLELVVTAAFIEAWVRWPSTVALDVEYVPIHQDNIRKQLQYYELTGAKALFFELLHVCLGDLTEADIQRADQRGGWREFHILTVDWNDPSAGLAVLHDIGTRIDSLFQQPVQPDGGQTHYLAQALFDEAQGCFFRGEHLPD